MNKNDITEKIVNLVKNDGYLVIPEVTGFGFQKLDNYFKLWCVCENMMLAGNNVSAEFKPSDVDYIELDDSEVYGKSINMILRDGGSVRIWL